MVLFEVCFFKRENFKLKNRAPPLQICAHEDYYQSKSFYLLVLQFVIWQRKVDGFSRQIISNYYFIFLIFFVVVVFFYFRYNKCIENYLDAIFTYYLRKIINEKSDEILNFRYVLDEFFLKMKK